MFELSAFVKTDITREKLSELAEINNKSAYYNLVLSEADILRLVSEQKSSLKLSGRIEFGFDTLEAIIDEFYKSPYVNQFEYADLLSELQFLFYLLKNEVDEAFSDEELIELIAEMFNGVCGGSVELLRGRGAEYIFELAKLRRQEKEQNGEVLRQSVNYGGGGGTDISMAVDRLELVNSLAAMLEELSLKYTGGRSFSIKAETAQSIVKSVLYAARLSGEGSFDLNRLRTAYYKGVGIIDGLIAETKRLYKTVKQTRVEAALAPYNETIDNIEGFFKSYDKEFASAEVPVQISYYPVLCDTRLEGIEFLKQFLTCLAIENKICGLFEKHDTERILTELEEKEQKSRTLLQPNIFEILVNNSIFAAMAGKRPSCILLEEADRQALNDIRLTDGVIDKSVKYFLKYYELYNSAELSEYITKYVSERLRPRIFAPDKKASLAEAAVFVKSEAQSFLYHGRQMPDELFRELIDKLNSEDNTDEKLKLIKANINSLSDVIDLLNEGIFCEREYESFFASLSGEELKILSNAAKRSANVVDNAEISAVSRLRPDDAWVKKLQEYFEG